ncbi:MAG: FG-GAP repeat domain-containing protein [Thermoplasmatota archaeon]
MRGYPYCALAILLLAGVSLPVLSTNPGCADSEAEGLHPDGDGSDASRFGAPSRMLFKDPRIIPDSMVWVYSWGTAEIFDLDGNGFPEIIGSWKGGQGKSAGTFSYQLDRSGNWTKTKLNDITHLITAANLSGDACLDFINFTYKDLSVGNPCISEGNATGNVTGTYPLDRILYGIEDFNIEDIDADGDRDFIYGSRSTYIHILRNNNSGDFIQEWESGIPDKEKDPTLPNLETRDVEVADINCDGWPDICTAMLCKGGYSTPDHTGYYNWLSSGNGSWTDCSEYFPRNQKSEDVELADLDNDGDTDYGLFTETSGYLYENLGRDGWRMRAFPNYSRFLREFHFEDVDGDGFQDIITVDATTVSGSYASHVNVSFGCGNFTWNTTTQFISTIGTPFSPVLEDMDRDGDRDMVMLSGYGIMYSENNGTSQPGISFTGTPLSRHLRSGMLIDLSWTMKDARSVLDSSPEFNLSISYTGKNGPFVHLEKITDRWSTEVLVPEIPSNDVYFRINWSGRSALSGRYFIHNSENMGSLVELVDPEDGGCLISGTDRKISLRTSRYFPDGSTELILRAGSETYGLGTFLLCSGTVDAVNISVPSDVFEEDCSIAASFIWMGSTVEADTGTRFWTAPPSEVPAHFSDSRFIVTSWSTTRIKMSVLSMTGKDITDRCTFDVGTFPSGIVMVELGKGDFDISSTETGEYAVGITASRFSINVDQDMIIEVVPPLESIELVVHDDDIRVGERFPITYAAKGPSGGKLTIEANKVKWHVNGDCTHSPAISGIWITPLSAGRIDVSAEADVGLGPVNGSIWVMARPMIREVKITTAGVEMMKGEEQELLLNVVRYDDTPLLGFDAKWSAGNNGLLNATEGCRLTLSALKEGELRVEVKVDYFNETSFGAISIKVLPRPIDIHIFEDLLLEKGEGRQFDVKVEGSDGKPYSGYLFFSIISDDPEIAAGEYTDGGLFMEGISEGTTYVAVNASTPEGAYIVENFPVWVTALPHSIELEEHPDILRIGEQLSIRFSVLDLEGEPLGGFDAELRAVGCIASLGENDTIRIVPTGIGQALIQLSASRFGTSVNTSFELMVVHNITGIRIIRSISASPVNTEVRFSLVLVDSEQNDIPWTEFKFDRSAGLYLIEDGDGYTATSSTPGVFRITVTADHFGRDVEAVFFFTFYESAVLKTMSADLQDDGHTIIVTCFDQDHGDITELCSIEWSGNVEVLNHYAARGLSGTVVVTASYNETTLRKEIWIPPDEGEDAGDGKGATSIWGIILGAAALMIAAGAAGFFLIRRSRKTTPEGGDFERPERSRNNDIPP